MKDKAKKIIQTLVDAGHTALFTGGCVRDMVMGVEPKDIDIATSATPDQVESLFKRTIPVGKAFGIIVVVMGDEEFEVATFRADSKGGDGRRPESVSFSTPEEDAQRRDLTINGMFYNPLTDEVIDFVGGQEDIKNKKIRFIGNAMDRVEEDRLRILRAVRFIAKFGFTPSAQTIAAIVTNAHRIHDVSAERIKDELDKMLLLDKPSVAFEWLYKLSLLQYVLPEVFTLNKSEQSLKWHSEGALFDNDGKLLRLGTVFDHTMLVVDNTRKRTSDLQTLWAALLHDIAKPQTAKVNGDGNISNHGHDVEGVEIAQSILRRLKSSNEEKEVVSGLVLHHMKPGMSRDMKKSTLRRMVALPFFDKLLTLSEADCESSIPLDPERENTKMDGVIFLRKFASETGPAKVLPEALVSGRHLIELGMKPGPKFKELLTAAMDKQLEGEITTTEEGIKFVKEMAG